jgi:L-asparagine transporter-like permease
MNQEEFIKSNNEQELHRGLEERHINLMSLGAAYSKNSE